MRGSEETMLERAASYDETRRRFSWRIPGRYNIGVDACDRHAAARPDATALIYEDEAGTVRRHTFKDIAAASNRLANVLKEHGLQRGERVGILLQQCPEAAVAHIAAYKAGLIAIPLFVLFGEDALEYRLSNAEARAVITDADNLPKVLAIRDRLPALKTILAVGGGPAPALDFHRELERARDGFAAVDTAADDPALIIYTSGTTGPPKGALHAHRVLLGHLPGVEFPHEFFPQAGDLYWTPADWAWIGGLLDVLLPAWHHGVPVLAHRFRKFDPHAASALMARHEVRNVFFPPTALKLTRQAGAAAPGVKLRSLASGGETLAAPLIEWGHATFGLTINEFYGQTECNVVVANCAGVMEVRPGSMGRAVPGHEVAVIDESGAICPAGAAGQIAIRRPDPVMFLGYWRNPAATADKFVGDWLITGDLGRQDKDGYIHYVGRADDVITSAGYRIGPSEIEDCLIKHPAVALAAAIGVPDPLRTEAVKVFAVLNPGYAGGAALVAELQDHVKKHLAAHEYPREIAFVDSLPMTATGKIMRRELRAQEAARRPASQSER